MLHTERDKASPFYFCTNSHVSSAEVNTSDHTLDLLCVSLGSVGGKAGNRLSINDSLNSLFMNISLGAGKILTPHEAHHSSRIMRTYHTHFGVPLENTTGWWDDRKRNQKSVLPLYLRLDIPSNLSRALSCLRLSGHDFLVQRMRHDRNRRPYELRICDRCDWHTNQDEEHILLDCPHEHLVRLHIQRQLIFPPQLRMAQLVWGP